MASMEIRIEDPALGLSAFVVIDLADHQGGLGGIRVSSALDEAELRELAGRMTDKLTFLGVHKFGGAKAAIAIPRDASPARRRQLLSAFGRRIAPLVRKGIFIPGTDLNMSPQDLGVVLSAAGMANGRIPDSARYTAHSVLESIRACADVGGLQLERLTCAIQGFGKVGSALAGLLHGLGALIVAVSTDAGTLYDPNGLDIKKLLALHDKRGPACLEAYGVPLRATPDLMRLPANVVCLCAGERTVTPLLASSMGAKILGLATNNPFSVGSDRILTERGILFVPDYIANSGGVLGSLLASHGVSEPRISRVWAQDFYAVAKALVNRASSLGVSPYIIADAIVQKSLNTARPTQSMSERAGAFARRLGFTAPALYGWHDVIKYRRTAKERVKQINAFRGAPAKKEDKPTNV